MGEQPASGPPISSRNCVVCPVQADDRGQPRAAAGKAAFP